LLSFVDGAVDSPSKLKKEIKEAIVRRNGRIRHLLKFFFKEMNLIGKCLSTENGLLLLFLVLNEISLVVL
jgi:hypothetical protein